MFWDIFYNLCQAQHTTPNAVCSKLDLSTATATNWKKNSVLPNGETLLKLADYFGCSVDYLLDRQCIDKQTDSVKNDLLLVYNNLSAEGRIRLLQYADDLQASGKYTLDK